MHSGAQNIQNLPSGVKNSSDLDVNAQDEMNYSCISHGVNISNSLPSNNLSSAFSENVILSPNSCVIENLLSFQAQETSKMVFASVNQANIFPRVSRGVQCTCNALMAIIQHNANTTQELDDILFAFWRITIHCSIYF